MAGRQAWAGARSGSLSALVTEERTAWGHVRRPEGGRALGKPGEVFGQCYWDQETCEELGVPCPESWLLAALG